MKQSFLPIGTWSVFVLTLLYSCSPTQKARTFDYDYLYINKQGIIQRPLIADLEVGVKKTYSNTFKNVTVEDARQQAIEAFIKQHNADLIVQPLFSIQAVDQQTKSSVTISLTGFPANYKNFRPYEPKDKDLLLPREYFLTLHDYPARAVSASQTTTAPKSKGNSTKKPGLLPVSLLPVSN